MPRLPQPGSDNGTWGDILNEYLAQAHKTDGTIKDNAVTANTIAPNSVTNAAIASDAINATSIADGSIANNHIIDNTIQETKLSANVQTKLNQTAPVTSVNTHTGVVTLDADDIDDSSAAHKFVTTTDLTKLSNTSGTNTGDQTLSDFGITASAAEINHTDGVTSNIQTQIDSKQVADADLTAIAGLTPSNDDLIQRKAGVWTNRTLAEVKTDFALTKSDVGLGNVDNTSDATKNSAVATLTNKTIDGSNNTISNVSLTSGVTGILPVANGGTGSGTKDFVDLSSNQTVAGQKTFTSNFILGDGTASTNMVLNGTSFNGVLTRVYSDTASAYSFFFRYRGTVGSPTQVTSGSFLGSFGFRGANETGVANSQDGARFSAIAEENVTSTSQATALVFYTAPTGTITASERMRISGSGDVTIPSAGTSSNSAVTIGATQTLTNKTLTSPKINQILDTNGALSLSIVPGSSPVNYMRLYNAGAGGSITLMTEGTDSNITFYLRSKGTGSIILSDNAALPVLRAIPTASSANYVTVRSAVTTGSPAIEASGTDTNIDLSLVGKGTGGVVLPMGSPLTLYNTSDQTTNYERARHYWSSNVYNISTERAGTGTVRDILISSNGSTTSLLLSGGSATKAVITTSTGTGTTGLNMTGSYTGTSLNQTAVSMKPIINQTGTAGYTALLINPTETATGSGTKLLIDAQVGGVSKFTVDSTGVTTVTAIGTGAGSVVSVDGAQTLTNKTLTAPKVNVLLDVNSNNSLALGAIPNAVNFVYIDNQSTGNYPTIGVDGPDADIGIGLAPRNNGPVNVFGNAPTIAAAGGYNGGNLDLNLKSQGTGIVKANGVPVVTQVVVPATASSVGIAGQIAYDADYFYQCVATDTWKRSPLTSW